MACYASDDDMIFDFQLTPDGSNSNSSQASTCEEDIYKSENKLVIMPGTGIKEFIIYSGIKALEQSERYLSSSNEGAAEKTCYCELRDEYYKLFVDRRLYSLNWQYHEKKLQLFKYSIPTHSSKIKREFLGYFPIDSLTLHKITNVTLNRKSRIFSCNVDFNVGFTVNGESLESQQTHEFFFKYSIEHSEESGLFYNNVLKCTQNGEQVWPLYTKKITTILEITRHSKTSEEKITFFSDIFSVRLRDDNNKRESTFVKSSDKKFKKALAIRCFQHDLSKSIAVITKEVFAAFCDSYTKSV